MSRTEAQVLLSRLSDALQDLHDMRWDNAVPQHVASATAAHIKHITEAMNEIRRLHQIGA